MLVSVSGWSGPSLAFTELQRLLEERQGQVQLPGSLIRHGEVVHAGERVGMVGAELRFLELQRLLEKRQGQVQLPGSPDTPWRGCSC